MDYNKQSQGQSQQGQQGNDQTDERKKQQAQGGPQTQGRREDEGNRLKEDEPTGRGSDGRSQAEKEDRT